MHPQAPDQTLPSPAAESVASDEETARERAAVLDELANRPLVYIANEVRRLRMENVDFRKESGKEKQQVAEEQQRLREEKQRVEELLSDIARLRDQQAGFKRAIRYLMEQTGFIMPTAAAQPIDVGRLPHEILVPILRAARVPPYQLDPSVSQGGNSQWLAELRYRKSLLLVCKWWTGPARELLYEDIVLRRVGQIPALAADLESQGDLARHVRSIRMDTCVIPSQCTEVARDALRSIFSLCTALRVFEYHPAEDFPVVAAPPTNFPAFNPSWFVDDSHVPFQVAFQGRISTLSVLDLAMTLSHRQLAHLHVLLSVAVRLKTLKLRSVERQRSDEGVELASLPILRHPQLEELHLSIQEPAFVAYVTTTWEMPRLVRLTGLDTTSVPHALLAAHGSCLVYLQLCPKRRHDVPHHYEWIPPDSAGLGRVVELCPVLEHLVHFQPMHFRWYETDDDLAMHRPRTLRYVDVCWSSATAARAPYSFGKPGITTRCIYFVHPDLPAICDPRIELGEGEARVVHLAGMRFLWTKRTIVPDVLGHAADCPPLAYEDPDADESSDYVDAEPPVSTDSEDSDASSEAGSEQRGDLELEGNADGAQGDTNEPNEATEDDTSDDERISEHESDYWRVDEQLDRDAVLKMYQASRHDSGY